MYITLVRWTDYLFYNISLFLVDLGYIFDLQIY